MQQFDLSLWLEDKSRKVVTRDGREVRIICWDIDSNTPVLVAFRLRQDREEVFAYGTDGKSIVSLEYDLFFADEEEELTKFELRLLSSLDYTRKFRQDFSDADMTKIIKDIAEELLELARKEILKDLPKYKKAEESKVLDWVVKLTEDGNIIFSDVIYKGEYFIMLQSLKTLPKEE